MANHNAQPSSTEILAPTTPKSGTSSRNDTRNEAEQSHLVTPRRSERQIANYGKPHLRELRISSRTRRLIYGESSTTDIEQVTPDRVRQVNRSMPRSNPSNPRNRRITSTIDAREASGLSTQRSGAGEVDSEDGSEPNPFRFYRCYKTPIVHILPLPEEEPEVLEIIIEDSPGRGSSPLAHS
ncbi:hypothetical protein DFH28DRAFT_1178449 [Melampsora americana]|nr:hypothetical protein DFH28DRAFT_1178449 [Melampsora americana]